MDEEQNLTKWNRGLVEKTIELLESSTAQTQEAISRLRGFLAVNPGGETVPLVAEEKTA